MTLTSAIIIAALILLCIAFAAMLMRAIRQRDEVTMLLNSRHEDAQLYHSSWQEAARRRDELDQQSTRLSAELVRFGEIALTRQAELEKCDAQNQDFYARLQRATAELGTCQRIVEGNNLELKQLRLQVNQLHEFCPDHRDKQRGKACLACTLETVRNKVQGARKLSSDDPRVLHGVSFMDGVLEFIASQSHRNHATHKKTATGSHS